MVKEGNGIVKYYYYYYYLFEIKRGASVGMVREAMGRMSLLFMSTSKGITFGNLEKDRTTKTDIR